MAIVGANGAGKSTLLRCLVRLLRPAAGRVLLDGLDLAGLPSRALARRMAYVPQETHLAFPYTALQVVLMGRLPHLPRFGFEGPEDLHTVRTAMELTETLDLAGRAVGELSTGERQRVLLARALAQGPEVLCLDEPTAHLDLRRRVAIYELLDRLRWEGGMTVVEVSHDLNLAAQRADRMAVLHRGRVATSGRPAEVVTAAMLREVFGVEALVTRPEGGAGPVVVPLQVTPGLEETSGPACR
ncbi:MAG: ABC transporter ATP-binding protein [Planctomycetes bacterium]|nr:ABC transporter ATP-binding protein [Planctomycetota bacterium]